ncbi:MULTISPECIES: uracil-DNA glycosylase family protein [Aquimarina]|uniref:Uracil-DNA glycosylase family protein n=1 Tax=Aquimarina algiphila TaxID=2047982 RepID=A0A554VK48_9FLAO|nr:MULTISPECIES: uracil-DNA glycosylase family protein [Aquimarina]TSE08357.1 uracil-DNA glycosylase family protein [Aquimarina algiphila]
MKELLQEISRCTVCSEHLELGPRPIVSGTIESKVVIIGQAPGTVVHRTGIPWDDKSGDNLRSWMGVDNDTFHNATKVGLVPMGFCYPGKGKSGDLPPRKECAPLWHNQLLKQMKNVELTILVGKYAQDYYLKEKSKRTLTETVHSFESYLPKYFVLPHPSPRNNIWQAKNEWFGKEVLPRLKEEINRLGLSS